MKQVSDQLLPFLVSDCAVCKSCLNTCFLRLIVAEAASVARRLFMCETLGFNGLNRSVFVKCAVVIRCFIDYVLLLDLAQFTCKNKMTKTNNDKK